MVHADYDRGWKGVGEVVGAVSEGTMMLRGPGEAWGLTLRGPLSRAVWEEGFCEGILGEELKWGAEVTATETLGEGMMQSRSWAEFSMRGSTVKGWFDGEG